MFLHPKKPIQERRFRWKSLPVRYATHLGTIFGKKTESDLQGGIRESVRVGKILSPKTSYTSSAVRTFRGVRSCGKVP